MKNKIAKFIKNLFGTNYLEIPAVRLSGVIAANKSALSSNNLNLSDCAAQLEKAFTQKDAPAVVLLINSPGGSPVQSHLIFQYIRQLATEYNKHVITFVEDVAASGGYMLACAGDEIFADPSSIVGSIGVIYSSFGFVELINKLGIDRRIHTAGKNKSILDPFLPEKENDVEHLKQLQLEIHDNFVNLVKNRRANKLIDDDKLFTGLFWTAISGKELGLVDDLDNAYNMIKKRYGQTTKLNIISKESSFINKIFPLFNKKYKASLSNEIINDVVSQIKDQDMWSKYKL